MKLIRLNDTDGGPVLVNIDQVCWIRPRFNDRHRVEGSVLTFSIYGQSGELAVKEAPAEIRALAESTL